MLFEEKKLWKKDANSTRTNNYLGLESFSKILLELTVSRRWMSAVSERFFFDNCCLPLFHLNLNSLLVFSKCWPCINKIGLFYSDTWKDWNVAVLSLQSLNHVFIFHGKSSWMNLSDYYKKNFFGLVNIIKFTHSVTCCVGSYFHWLWIYMKW